MAELKNKEAYKIIFWQLIIMMGLALVLFLLQGLRSGWSAMMGGLAYWLPTLLFVWRVFADTSARAAKKFLVKFVLGEVSRLLLSGILCFLVVAYLPVNTLSVILGFIGAIVAFWFASLIVMCSEKGVRT